MIIEYGSEFDFNANSPYLETELQNNFSDSVLLRSGRDALKLIAKHYSGENRKIFLPALSCDSMIEPFRQFKFNINYYPINENFTANELYIEKNIGTDDLLLVNDYFGMASLEDKFLKKLKQKKVKIIQDVTQHILHYKAYHADYVIASIRKWFALPDGGLLIDRNKEIPYKKLVIENEHFSQIRKIGLQIKSDYLSNGVSGLKKEYRKYFLDAEKYINEIEDIAMISNDTKIILEKINFNKLGRQRSENAEALFNQLSPLKQKCYVWKTIPKSPLYFPLLVNNRDIIQQKLAEKNLYCPVIWPIDEKARLISPFSRFISDHILAIPCDQRYNVNDMKKIADMILRIVE